MSWRVAQLKALRAMIEASRDTMHEALWHDLRRNRTDAGLMDVDWSIREADYALDHLHDWLRQDHVHRPLLIEPGHVRVRVRHDPLGVTLIIGAWNEPYMVTVGPLVAAIAAGNTALVKRSEICEACAAQLAEMVPKYLVPKAVAVGGIPETTALLAQKWDPIFFTGSPPVGKIVHSSAELKTAARRIAFTRFINSGHICTAPDHVLVWPEVKDEFVERLKEAIHTFCGDDPKQSPDYAA